MKVIRSRGPSLHEWNSSLMKEAPKRSFPLCLVKTEQKHDHLWTRKQLSPAVKSAGTLIWDFPNHRSVKNKFLLFISYSAYGVCNSSPDRLRCGVKEIEQSELISELMLKVEEISRWGNIWGTYKYLTFWCCHIFVTYKYHNQTSSTLQD